MKIAIVRQRYNPFGGAERFVERALQALEKQHEVRLTLITREWDSDKQRDVRICNPSYLGRRGRDAGFSQAVQALVANGEFDLVQSHERIPGCHIFRAGDGVHAAWLVQRARQQSALARLATRWSPWHRYTLKAEREMLSDPRLRAVICISQLVKNDIQRHYGVPDEKLHVIYNGIDLEQFHPRLKALHRDSVRKELAIPADAPVFIYVGSGFERKGVTQLLQAAARVPSAWLIVVGADKHLDRYRAYARRLGMDDRVRFTDGVRDVRPFYGAADAFVLPTLYEPLSNAVLEALACGLPAILSDQCGAAELVVPGESGYVCDALDVGALARHIGTLAQPGSASSMAAAARQAVEPYDIDSMTGRLMGLYASLL